MTTSAIDDALKAFTTPAEERKEVYMEFVANIKRLKKHHYSHTTTRLAAALAANTFSTSTLRYFDLDHSENFQPHCNVLTSMLRCRDLIWNVRMRISMLKFVRRVKAIQRAFRCFLSRRNFAFMRAMRLWLLRAPPVTVAPPSTLKHLAAQRHTSDLAGLNGAGNVVTPHTENSVDVDLLMEVIVTAYKKVKAEYLLPKLRREILLEKRETRKRKGIVVLAGYDDLASSDDDDPDRDPMNQVENAAQLAKKTELQCLASLFTGYWTTADDFFIRPLKMKAAKKEDLERQKALMMEEQRRKILSRPGSPASSLRLPPPASPSRSASPIGRRRSTTQSSASLLAQAPDSSSEDDEETTRRKELAGEVGGAINVLYRRYKERHGKIFFEDCHLIIEETLARCRLVEMRRALARRKRPTGGVSKRRGSLTEQTQAQAGGKKNMDDVGEEDEYLEDFAKRVQARAPGKPVKVQIVHTTPPPGVRDPVKTQWIGPKIKPGSAYVPLVHLLTGAEPPGEEAEREAQRERRSSLNNVDSKTKKVVGFHGAASSSDFPAAESHRVEEPERDPSLGRYTFQTRTWTMVTEVYAHSRAQKGDSAHFAQRAIEEALYPGGIDNYQNSFATGGAGAAKKEAKNAPSMGALSVMIGKGEKKLMVIKGLKQIRKDQVTTLVSGPGSGSDGESESEQTLPTSPVSTTTIGNATVVVEEGVGRKKNRKSSLAGSSVAFFEDSDSDEDGRNEDGRGGDFGRRDASKKRRSSSVSFVNNEEDSSGPKIQLSLGFSGRSGSVSSGVGSPPRNQHEGDSTRSFSPSVSNRWSSPTALIGSMVNLKNDSSVGFCEMELAGSPLSMNNVSRNFTAADGSGVQQGQGLGPQDSLSRSGHYRFGSFKTAREREASGILLDGGSSPGPGSPVEAGVQRSMRSSMRPSSPKTLQGKPSVPPTTAATKATPTSPKLPGGGGDEAPVSSFLEKNTLYRSNAFGGSSVAYPDKPEHLKKAKERKKTKLAREQSLNEFIYRGEASGMPATEEESKRQSRSRLRIDTRDDEEWALWEEHDQRIAEENEQARFGEPGGFCREQSPVPDDVKQERAETQERQKSNIIADDLASSKRGASCGSLFFKAYLSCQQDPATVMKEVLRKQLMSFAPGGNCDYMRVSPSESGVGGAGGAFKSDLAISAERRVFELDRKKRLRKEREDQLRAEAEEREKHHGQLPEKTHQATPTVSPRKHFKQSTSTNTNASLKAAKALTITSRQHQKSSSHHRQVVETPIEDDLIKSPSSYASFIAASKGGALNSSPSPSKMRSFQNVPTTTDATQQEVPPPLLPFGSTPTPSGDARRKSVGFSIPSTEDKLEPQNTGSRGSTGSRPRSEDSTAASDADADTHNRSTSSGGWSKLRGLVPGGEPLRNAGAPLRTMNSMSNFGVDSMIGNPLNPSTSAALGGTAGGGGPSGRYGRRASIAVEAVRALRGGIPTMSEKEAAEREKQEDSQRAREKGGAGGGKKGGGKNSSSVLGEKEDSTTELAVTRLVGGKNEVVALQCLVPEESPIQQRMFRYGANNDVPLVHITINPKAAATSPSTKQSTGMKQNPSGNGTRDHSAQLSAHNKAIQEQQEEALRQQIRERTATHLPLREVTGALGSMVDSDAKLFSERMQATQDKTIKKIRMAVLTLEKEVSFAVSELDEATAKANEASQKPSDQQQDLVAEKSVAFTPSSETGGIPFAELSVTSDALGDGSNTIEPPAGTMKTDGSNNKPEKKNKTRLLGCGSQFVRSMKMVKPNRQIKTLSSSTASTATNPPTPQKQIGPKKVTIAPQSTVAGSTKQQQAPDHLTLWKQEQLHQRKEKDHLSLVQELANEVEAQEMEATEISRVASAAAARRTSGATPTSVSFHHKFYQQLDEFEKPAELSVQLGLCTTAALERSRLAIMTQGDATLRPGATPMPGVIKKKR